MSFSDLSNGKGNSPMKSGKVCVLDRLVRKQVAAWQIDGISSNTPSSALQYAKVFWLQIKLELISFKILCAFGFGFGTMGPPDLLALYFVCGQWSLDSS